MHWRGPPDPPASHRRSTGGTRRSSGSRRQSRSSCGVQTETTSASLGPSAGRGRDHGHLPRGALPRRRCDRRPAPRHRGQGGADHRQATQRAIGAVHAAHLTFIKQHTKFENLARIDRPWRPAASATTQVAARGVGRRQASARGLRERDGPAQDRVGASNERGVCVRQGRRFWPSRGSGVDEARSVRVLLPHHDVQACGPARSWGPLRTNGRRVARGLLGR